MAEQKSFEIECVDSEVGERVLETRRPGLDPATRDLLEAHLEVCAFCRQTVELEQRLATSMGRGRIVELRRVRSIWAGAAAATAAIAAVLCMTMLTPRPSGPAVSIRGAEGSRFLRPVEGEVVVQDHLVATWTEVPGADSYELELSTINGQSSWVASISETSWTAPEDVELRAGDSYRLVLATVPADLLPPGAASVRFRVGRVPDLIRYRVTRAQPIAYGLLAAALLLVIVSVRLRRVPWRSET